MHFHKTEDSSLNNLDISSLILSTCMFHTQETCKNADWLSQIGNLIAQGQKDVCTAQFASKS
jgi:hypothetical protein